MEIDLQEEINKSARLRSCEVCSENPSKYTCPRCEAKTCSLKCSKNHKTEEECNGIRDRTKYKPLNQMTTLDFMNDYYFLEEATRFAKDIKCKPKVNTSKRTYQGLAKLKREAKKRNITLYFVNNALSKHKRNRSHAVFNRVGQTDTIFWLVEFVFPNASNFVKHKKFDEKLKVKEMLQQIIDDQDKELEFYRAERINKLRVFLKAEGLKNSNNRFYEMNIEKSLNANLKGKFVIEYPTIRVVMNHSADDLDIIESDDESVGIELKNFTRTLYEEVLSHKVGVNPPLVLNAEEVPIISEIIDDRVQQTGNTNEPPTLAEAYKPVQMLESNDSDEESIIRSGNYLFSIDL